MADDNSRPDDPLNEFLKWVFGQDLGDQFNSSAEPANDDVAPFEAPEKPAVTRKMGNAEHFEI